MKFVIAHQDNFNIVSEHDTLDEAKRIYLDYYRECCSERKIPKNWIFKQKDSGEFLTFPKKEDSKLRRFFIENK